MKRPQLTSTLVLTMLVSAAIAQQTPNFAGKWTVIPDPSGAGGPGALGASAVVKQEAASMTITRTTPMGEFTSTYKLDGSESKNTLNFQGNAIEQVSKTKWDGGTLRIDTSMSFNGNPVQLTLSLSLDASGNLVAVSTRPDFQGGSAPITTKTTYKKAE